MPVVPHCTMLFLSFDELAAGKLMYLSRFQVEKSNGAIPATISFAQDYFKRYLSKAYGFQLNEITLQNVSPES